MELELKDIRERPLILFIFIAVVIHIAIGFVVWTQLKTPSAKAFISGTAQPADKLPIIEGITNPLENSAKTDLPNETVSGEIENKPDEPANTPISQEETASSTGELPPFEQSPLTKNHSIEKTFVHEASGLLFADEIQLPDKNKPPVKQQKIIPPQIHREFSVRGLPLEFRSKEWNLKLRLRVNREGNPVGKIKVMKSSGDNVLDQITITRVSESRFEPAHYEGSTDFIDYTFDLDIIYK
ncbi:MAG: energy transducer TonB [bacterium]